MASAFFAPTASAAPAVPESLSSSLSAFAKRVVDAVVEVRMKSAESQLRRHEALVNDLCRRQDHSPLFLNQDEPLPFKI
jgi:hypothetical protein